MKLIGKVYKDAGGWLAELPALDAMTQGRTRKEAVAMLEDWVVSMSDESALEVEAACQKDGVVTLHCNQPRLLIALMLQRLRQMSGLTLEEVAERLGVKSKNAYARYERGASTPTVEKLDELIEAVSPDGGLVVGAM